MKIKAAIITACALPTVIALTKEEAAADLDKNLDLYKPADLNGDCPSSINDVIGLIPCFTKMPEGIEDALEAVKCISKQACSDDTALGKKIKSCNKNLDDVLAPFLKDPMIKPLLEQASKAVGIDLTDPKCKTVVALAGIEGLDAICYPPFALLRTGLCAAVPVIEEYANKGDVDQKVITDGINAFGCLTFSQKVIGATWADKTATDVDELFSCKDETVKVMTSEAEKNVPDDYKPPAAKEPEGGKNDAASASASALIAATTAAAAISLLA